MPDSPPIALSIAGSDCSSGAGIQADLKSFTEHGVFGLTAVTCVVAEIPGHVGSIAPVPVEVLAEQLVLLRDAFPIAAIKTGMLYSSDHVRVVVDWLQSFNHPPLIVDPVMVATSGQSLLKDGALAVYTQELLPMATLVTPNINEAIALGSAEIGDKQELIEAARWLARVFGTSVLVKGGHLRGQTASDAMASPAGHTHVLNSPYFSGVKTHGTGCTYSAAIAANLACGQDLPTSVSNAKGFVTAAIRGYFHWRDTDALNHFQQED